MLSPDYRRLSSNASENGRAFFEGIKIDFIIVFQDSGRYLVVLIKAILQDFAKHAKHVDMWRTHTFGSSA
jgi:hypothetical protein